MICPCYHFEYRSFSLTIQEVSWEYWRRACRFPALQFSTSVEVRLGVHHPCEDRLVNSFSQNPRQGFLSFLAWMFNSMRERNVHGVFSGKNPDHPKITILYFWMICIVFGHFLKSSVLDQLDIAYLDSIKLFPQIRYNISHAGSFKNLKITIFYCWMIPNFSQESCIRYCSNLGGL